MINIRDIKIGNIIHFDIKGHEHYAEEDVIVESISSKEIRANPYLCFNCHKCPHKCCYIRPPESFLPIELTEKWLIKFGFIRHNGYFNDNLNGFMIDENLTPIMESDHEGYMIKIAPTTKIKVY